ncbi:nicotinate-nucleotide--dimethylbenzimidazole phosphoribosyltransferase [Paenibacillus sp. y28]|uniref:nicotinate-nucleotide--dimethylbenzimidazole phosphoribosyltransferase n=1 Tax=Paenibacillus sp. y28 TaxID=3129110 RepID=UPI00301A8014
MNSQLQQWVEQIKPLDEAAQVRAQAHLDQLTKPPGSLGQLERLAVQLAGITGETIPDLGRKAIIVMAGDHGVCEEGVSAFPAEVTGQMVLNFLHGGAAVNVLARHAGADVVCVDIGVRGDLEHPGLVSRKVKHGTANIAKGPAMTTDEAIEAICAGFELVQQMASEGCRVFATGEMGIGNTTPSSALLAVLTGTEVAGTVGRGTGITDSVLLHKQEVIRRAIETNRPNPEDALDVLAKLGGLEIAGLTGVILGAAASRCPIIIDGFISTAAMLVAARLAPACVPYAIASHLSMEPGHRRLMDAIGLTPVLHMDMRLGEGTGAALLLPVLDAALKIMREMATFASAGVSRSEEA